MNEDIRATVDWEGLIRLSRSRVRDVLPASQMSYLGTPYSHDDHEVMQSRYEFVTHVAGQLILKHERITFSPITHNHPIQRLHVKRGEDVRGWEDWATHDTWFMREASSLLVLGAKGYTTSIGLAHEIKHFERSYKSIYLLDPDEWVLPVV